MALVYNGLSTYKLSPAYQAAAAWLGAGVSEAPAAVQSDCWTRSTIFAVANIVRVRGNAAPRDVCLAACSTRAIWAWLPKRLLLMQPFAASSACVKHRRTPALGRGTLIVRIQTIDFDRSDGAREQAPAK
jgi:hypothetical protein